ncbi:hypothetical protein NLG97_g7582 [Lecanicillium saksenae]|uniref:Uncharacterized protein n=1 Tax=Lecanicillium saksenae TaxID=468837 RepID=A0ACC1QPM0_9HYPO|nr:hypothetical protein NLG97_g7582 [Lecanicillium saksenae]
MDTLRDAANFASTSKACNDFMDLYGWKLFFQSKFPSITVPPMPDKPFDWRMRAARLAMLDRAWERRSFDIYSYGEHPLAPWDGQYFRRGGAVNIAHTTPIDARLMCNTTEEIVACGAGEDLMVRRSAIHGRAPGLWAQHLGEDFGFTSGKGDITALSVVQRWSEPEIITGRANGEFHLHRLVDNRVQNMVRLWPPWRLESGRTNINWQNIPHFNLDKTSISSMDWHSTHNLLATAQDATLQLWRPPTSSEEAAEVQSKGIFSVQNDGESDSMPSYIRAVKFLDDVNVACGIDGTKTPLRWGRITPYGLQMQMAQNDVHDAFFGTNSVTAVEAVGVTGKLVLSAWNDGTLRLTDLRTAKPYDSIYRNGANPRYVSGSLITHGLERFVAGSNVSPDLHFFDYRNPAKVYFHSNAMPCSGRSLYPGWNLNTWATPELPGFTRCHPKSGRLCRWHRESRSPLSRPDATMRVYNLVFERVTALARSCEFSDTFYTGMQGGLLEVRLAEDLQDYAIGGGRENVWTADVSRIWDGSAKSRAWSRKQRPNALITMEETGCGRYDNLFSLPSSLEWSQVEELWDNKPDAMFLDQTGWVTRSKIRSKEELERFKHLRLEPNWLRNRPVVTRIPMYAESSSFIAEESGDEMSLALGRMHIR